MKTREPGRFSYLLLGVGLGAMGGVVSALLARREMRDLLRERSRNSLEYLNQQAAKLRATAEEVAKKGKEFIGPHRDPLATDAEAERQVYEEEKRETSGG